MTGLAELLEIEGVVAAGEWAKDGSLSDYKASMDMSPELAAGAAQFCATVSMMFDTLSGAFSQMSGMNWTPQQGWAYSGGDWTVAKVSSSRPPKPISTNSSALWSASKVHGSTR
jgi:roadblock/LC7 domain-containing protein